MGWVRATWIDWIAAHGIGRRVSSALKKWSGLVPVLLFLLNLVLLFPVFFPNLSEIICFDEAGYVYLGRLLYDGHLPSYASNPLIALLYLLGYAAVRGSRFWLLHSLTIGRFVLFALLWLGACQIARKLASRAYPLVLVAFMFVSPVLRTLLTNPSDALFAAMSALAFWQFLCFLEKRALGHLRNTSILLGLAALARNDGLVLFLVFALAAILLCLPKKRIARVLLCSFVPFGALVGGYLLLYRAVVGRFELGTGDRMYTAFEQGQGVAYSELYGSASPYVQGQVEARRLYGTPEENSNSVLAAISRNPHAFIARVIQVAKSLPGQAVSVYGLGIGAILFLFAARGVAHLIKNRDYLLLGIMLLWCVPLLVYFLTFFRPGYLLLPYFVAFSLAATGITASLSNLSSRNERLLWSLLYLALAAYGLVKRQPVPFAIATSFLVGLWLAWAIMRREPAEETARWVPFASILCIALAVANGYVRPEFRTLGAAPDEKAALFMRDHLAPGAHVASFAPCVVWLADMVYVPISFDLRSVTTGQDLLHWLNSRQVKAIYVDDRLRNNEPETLQRILGMIGKGVDPGFQSGSVQVLLIHEVR